MDKTIILDWIKNHWNDVVGVIGGGFGFWSWYQTRSDRQYKHNLLKDHARAEPLRDNLLKTYFQTKTIQPYDCENLYNYIKSLGLKFIHKGIQRKYSDLLNRLKYLAIDHPERHAYFLVQISGTTAEPFHEKNPKYGLIYKPEVKAWISDWQEFMRYLEVETAAKEG